MLHSSTSITEYVDSITEYGIIDEERHKIALREGTTQEQIMEVTREQSQVKAMQPQNEKFVELDFYQDVPYLMAEAECPFCHKTALFSCLESWASHLKPLELCLHVRSVGVNDEGNRDVGFRLIDD